MRQNYPLNDFSVLMWTILTTFVFVLFASILVYLLRDFYRGKFLSRLESEVENDLAEEFPLFQDNQKPDSEEFIEWLEELQLEQEIEKALKHK